MGSGGALGIMLAGGGCRSCQPAVGVGSLNLGGALALCPNRFGGYWGFQRSHANYRLQPHTGQQAADLANCGIGVTSFQLCDVRLGHVRSFRQCCLSHSGGLPCVGKRRRCLKLCCLRTELPSILNVLQPTGVAIPNLMLSQGTLLMVQDVQLVGFRLSPTPGGEFDAISFGSRLV